ALARARRLGLTVIRAGVDPPGLPFAAESADVVIMSELIEHLVDTDSALDEVFRVLRPGGSLLLSTPNLAAWYNRGLGALGGQPARRCRRAGSPGRGPPAPVPPPRAGAAAHRARLRPRHGHRRAVPRRAAAAPARGPGVLRLARGRLDPAGPGRQDMTLRALA